MTDFVATAEAFVAMAHRIVWCSAATVEPDGRPRTRILHPIWEWDGARLQGWIATGKTPVKARDLGANPHVSLSYWAPDHDTCSAECRTAWADDIDTRRRIWDLYLHAPPPVGYDPSIIPTWDGPDSPTFSVLSLEPYRLRVFPGTVLLGQGGEVRTWRAPAG